MEHTKEEKKVEYLELIYDLIFVYIIGRNNSLLHHIEGGRMQSGVFLGYILCTLAVIQIWNYSAYYINMYGRNGLREHIFLFGNMFLLYFIGEGTSVHWQSFHTQYHVAWGLILLNIAVQYAIEYRERREHPEQLAVIKLVMLTLIAEAVMVFTAIPLYKLTGQDLSFIPIVFGIAVTTFSGRKSIGTAVDFTHLSERAMLYVVFTFGEMVIAIAGYFDGTLSFNRIYFSLMAFLIVVGLFLSYGTFYDHIIDREQENNGLWYMMLHIFIIFGLNNITTSLEFMQDEEVELLPKLSFLILSFMTYFVFLFLTRHYAKKTCRPPIGFYLRLGILALSFIALMIIFCENMAVNIAVSAIFVFIIYGIIYRLGKFNRS